MDVTTGNSWAPLVLTTTSDSTLVDTITWSTVQSAVSQDMAWEGVLAVEGLPTSDGRYLMPGKIEHRELPLSLMAQFINDEGHKQSIIAGKITSIDWEDRRDLGEGAIGITARGEFANTDEGRMAAQLVADQVLRHVSIDFAPTASYMLDKETHEVIDDEEMGLEALLGGEFLRGYEGKIMGATLCAFSAFEDATMQIVEIDSERAIIASAFPRRIVLTASAAGIAPMKPPKEWFYTEETDGPCPLTVTAEGRVFGHLALWNQCHRSITDHCEMAPRSRSGYAFFHTGSLTTHEGEKVSVGRITVGDGGHASTDPRLGLSGAIDHYDKTGIVGAFVRATDGRYGIWLSGAVRSDCPAEKVRDMEANPPSGDWREESRSLELCAALSVPVAGFPVPRYEASLVASGADEEHVAALIATGYTENGEFTRADQRRFERLKKEARGLLQ